MMPLLAAIKPRLGVYYTDEVKDSELRQLINGAVAYFKGAGWDLTSLLSTLEEQQALKAELEAELADLEAIKEPSPAEEERIGELAEEIAGAVSAVNATTKSLALPVEAVTLYCKMAEPTSAFQMTNHPVLTSMIAQGRSDTDAGI